MTSTSGHAGLHAYMELSTLVKKKQARSKWKKPNWKQQDEIVCSGRMIIFSSINNFSSQIEIIVKT